MLYFKSILSIILISASLYLWYSYKNYRLSRQIHSVPKRCRQENLLPTQGTADRMPFYTGWPGAGGEELAPLCRQLCRACSERAVPDRIFTPYQRTGKIVFHHRGAWRPDPTGAWRPQQHPDARSKAVCRAMAKTCSDAVIQGGVNQTMNEMKGETSYETIGQSRHRMCPAKRCADADQGSLCQRTCGRYGP